MLPFSLPVFLRAILVWLLIIAGESVHGALRRLLLSPDVIFAARQVSVVIGVLIVFAVTWICLPWLRLRSMRGALAVGVLWVALTLAFEIVLGRALGFGWDRILAEYDLSRGNLMPLGLLAMAITPVVVRRLQAPRRKFRDAA